LDDVEVALEAKIEIAIVTGCEANIKITMPEDFKRAQKIIEEKT
jgi:2-C-methyl-D-erythritol 4-phosphate cytidylyltransferase